MKNQISVSNCSQLIIKFGSALFGECNRFGWVLSFGSSIACEWRVAFGAKKGAQALAFVETNWQLFDVSQVAVK
jgi:hypothetical protein